MGHRRSGDADRRRGHRSGLPDASASQMASSSNDCGGAHRHRLERRPGQRSSGSARAIARARDDARDRRRPRRAAVRSRVFTVADVIAHRRALAATDPGGRAAIATEATSRPPRRPGDDRLHVGHDRRAEGRDAVARQHPVERRARRRGGSASTPPDARSSRSCRSATCSSGCAVPLPVRRRRPSTSPSRMTTVARDLHASSRRS